LEARAGDGKPMIAQYMIFELAESIEIRADAADQPLNV
jgi:hypothetical protein